MGGLMQAQRHLQLAIRILAHGQNPQAAANGPRWRGARWHSEPGMNPRLVEALKALGYDIVVERPDALFAFGGAQIVLPLLARQQLRFNLPQPDVSVIRAAPQTFIGGATR
jgi:gamma-glutamyltranspeptidase/glutathione hydrolase